LLFIYTLTGGESQCHMQHITVQCVTSQHVMSQYVTNSPYYGATLESKVYLVDWSYTHSLHSKHV